GRSIGAKQGAGWIWYWREDWEKVYTSWVVTEGGYEEEMSRGIFVLRETDEGYYDIPLYSRFKQVEYKGVPPPLSGDYTPRAQEDIDDSLYVYGKHGPQPQSPSPTESNASSIVFSICPSNDSDGELGAVQNWNQRMERELGAGYSFVRKPCFVCGSLSHLIKDCDYYEKKMAREAAFKSTRVVHANVRQATPAWTNSNRFTRSTSRPKPVKSWVPKRKLSLFDLNGGFFYISFLKKIATKNDSTTTRHPSSTTTISKSADDIMTFIKNGSFALKHLGRSTLQQYLPSTNSCNTGSSNLNTAFRGSIDWQYWKLSPYEGIFEKASYDDDGIISDFNNLPDEVDVPTNPTLRIPCSSSKWKWVEAMQEELLQFQAQQVYGICLIYPMVLNDQFIRQEEGIDYDEVFAPVARIEAIRSTSQAEQGRHLHLSRQVCKKLKKFDLVHVKAAITPMETKLPLTKDEEAFDVDYVFVHVFSNSKDFSSQCCQEDLQVPQGPNQLGIMKPQHVVGNFLVKDSLLAMQETDYCSLTSTTEAEYVCITAIPTINDSHCETILAEWLLQSTREDGSPPILVVQHLIQKGQPRPLLPSMLLVATNLIAGQEHAAQAQTQPTPPPPPIPTPIPSTTPTPIPTSTPPPPPIPSTTPTPIPTPTSPPPPPPETEPSTDEHIYEEQSPVHHPFSPSQEQAPSHMPTADLLQTLPKLISRIDSLELDLKQTKLTMGNAIVKLVKKVKKLEGFLKRRNLVLTDSEDEEPEVQGRNSQADPQDSSTQGLVTPPTTKLMASQGEEQEEEISQTLLFNAASKEVKLLVKDNTGSIELNTVIEPDIQLVKIKDKEKESFLLLSIDSFVPISFEATKDSLKRFGEELQTKTPKRLKEDKDDEAKDDEPTKKLTKRRKQIARKGMHTSMDENVSDDSDKVDEQEETNTGTETPLNPVPVAMKTPSVATYKIIKQGEKGVYQIVREDGTI
ncbi:hypothetical protein Tco_0443101, partial [Tanacetum coccineum]